jgi:ABC-type lipoprotein release transport system permease subunit
LLIARRYLIGKKSQKAINLITMISIVVMMVVTAAMVVVLSTMNGVTDLVDQIYSPLDQDITITPTQGKTLDRDHEPLLAVIAMNEVQQSSFFIEENVLFKCKDRQVVGTLKGVEESYMEMSDMQRYLYVGKSVLTRNDREFAIMGIGLKVDLGVPLNDDVFEPLQIMAPIRGKKLSKYKQAAFEREDVAVSGAFSMNIEYDTRYVLCPLSMASRVLHYDSLATGLEIKLHDPRRMDKFSEKIQTLLGADYTVKTRYQKNALMYQTNKSEKWFTFLVLLFIALIGAFNIIASLTMMMIEKKKDMHMLTSMGATAVVIRSIFFFEGMMIAMLGTVIGISLGLLLCFLQQSFGFIGLSGSIVDAYPVRVLWQDLVLVFVSIGAIGVLASWIPLRSLSKRYLQPSTAKTLA